MTHSRHHEAPVAPYHQLSKLTSSILTAPLGSLYSFSPQDLQNYLHPHDVSDVITQKVEYIMRGYSALIPKSLLECPSKTQLNYRLDIPKQGSKEYTEWTEQRSEKYWSEYVSQMEALVTRLEEEGDHYQQMAEEYRLAQLSPTIPSNDEPTNNNTNNTSTNYITNNITNNNTKPIQEQCSSPGPSIHIYELLLDAHTLITAPSTPFPKSSRSFLQTLQSLHTTILHRHNLDGQYQNTNPKTMPTTITFNAILRAISKLPYLPPTQNTIQHLSTMSIPIQQIRDDTLLLTFQTYEQMTSTTTTHRNSCTYLYLLTILHTILPPCRSRGNMVRYYIDQACQEGVMTQSLLEWLVETKMEEDGKHYYQWVDQWMEEYGGSHQDFPLTWRRFVHKYSSKGAAKGIY